MFPAFPPLVFEPLFRSYLWGGRQLATKLGKNLPAEGIWAESWEIIDHPQGQSIVASGPWKGHTLGQLVASHPEAILGQAVTQETGSDVQTAQFTRFPLLLKYLDCQNMLSVQVHPDDAYGLRMPTPDLGKTEAWYIIDAEPGALLYAGLKQGVSCRDLVRAIDSGRTEECLHTISPQAGDCVFIPAGTVHALGAGLIVAEIQQASDCTFRLFDWNRVDATGNPRPLHINQALDVIDFERGPVERVAPVKLDQSGAQQLVSCDKFRLVRFLQPSTYELDLTTCKIVAVPQGNAIIESNHGPTMLRTGQSALVPHACQTATLTVKSDSTVLVAEPVLTPGSNPNSIDGTTR